MIFLRNLGSFQPRSSSELISLSPEKQTYHGWQQKFFKKKPKKNHIYILPLGEFPSHAPALDAIRDYCKAFYTPLHVSCLEPLPINFKKTKGSKKASLTLDISSLYEHIAETGCFLCYFLPLISGS